MKAKSIGVGLISAALCAMPAFSQAKYVAQGVWCGGPDFADDGGFTRWSHNAHGAYYSQGVTDDDNDIEYVALQIAATGARAGSFQIDWNSNLSDDPAFFIWFQYGNNGYDFDFEPLDDLSDSFRFRYVGGGFYRFLYNPGAPRGYQFGNIFAADYLFGDTGSDVMANVFVNGAPVIPNVHNSTQYNCNASYE